MDVEVDFECNFRRDLLLTVRTRDVDAMRVVRVTCEFVAVVEVNLAHLAVVNAVLQVTFSLVTTSDVTFSSVN